MKRILLIFIISMFSLFVYSQKMNNKKFSEILNTKELKAAILKSCYKENDINNIVIHYFDAECATCIGGMIELFHLFAQENKGINSLIFILQANDTILFNYYKERDAPDANLIYDIDRFLYNNYFHSNNKTIIINNNGELIFENEWPYTEDAKRELIEALK